MVRLTLNSTKDTYKLRLSIIILLIVFKSLSGAAIPPLVSPSHVHLPSWHLLYTLSLSPEKWLEKKSLSLMCVTHCHSFCIAHLLCNRLLCSPLQFRGCHKHFCCSGEDLLGKQLQKSSSVGHKDVIVLDCCEKCARGPLWQWTRHVRSVEME